MWLGALGEKRRWGRRIVCRCFWNPDSVAEVTTMVRAAHLRNLLEASLKVRSMCVTEKQAQVFQVHWETWWRIFHFNQLTNDCCNVI